ncbi:MAG: transporter, partial [Solirubrobacterales bacterium]|nr:transporter [Solirubrobacterales bacterium]
SRDTSHDQRLDPLGLLSSGIALFALTYALIEANTYGWGSGRILGLFAIAAVFFVAFVLLERHQRIPMLDLSLFKNATFAASNAVMLLVGLAMFGVFFFISLFVQGVLHYSPTQAGATFLPMTVLIILIAPQAGRLSDRFGPRWLITVGQALLAVSLLLFSRLDAQSDFYDLLPALVIGGFGMALSMAPLTSAAMGSIPTDKAGVGSAVINSMRQVGGSVGLALMGAIIASQGAATATAPFTIHGFQLGLRTSAAIAACGCLIAASFIREVRVRGAQPAPETA